MMNLRIYTKQSYRDKHNENNIRNHRYSGIGHLFSNLWTTANNLGIEHFVPITGNFVHMGDMVCNRSSWLMDSWTRGFSEEQITLQG